MDYINVRPKADK